MAKWRIPDVIETDVGSNAGPEGAHARRRLARPSRTVLALLVLVVAAFSIAVLVHRSAFPYFSGDDDDTVYVFEAKTLVHGHLTLSASKQGEFFRPWLSGIRDGRVVLPFQFGWPAVLAASDLLFGTTVVALGLTAAALAVVSWLLAREITRDRLKATIAAAFVLGSPFFLIHSGTYLNYLVTLVLELSFVLLALLGLRRQSSPLLMAAGLLLGAVLLTRPFDAVLIAIPVGLYLIAREKPAWRRLGASVGWLGIGFAGPLALALALNAQLTGHLFTFPEAVNGGIQTFGFGSKRLAQGTKLVDYSFGVALRSLGRNLLSLPKYFFGGLVALGLAVWGATRASLAQYRILLIGIALVFPIGYVFWWGSYLSVAARNSIGPHYYMPAMVPVAIFAADLLVDLYRRRAVVAGALLAVMIGATAAVLPSTFSAATALPDTFRRDHAAVAAAHLTNALVFLPRAPDNANYVLHPFPYLQNEPDLSGHALYASEHGAGDFALLNEYPRRTAYQLLQSVPEGGDILRPSYQAVRLSPRRGHQLVVDLLEANPNAKAPSAFAYVAVDRHLRLSVPLSATSQRGSPYEVRWSLTPGSVSLLGADGRALMTTGIPRSGALSFGMGFGAPGSPQRAELVERRLSYRSTRGSSEVLLPGELWYRFTIQRTFWLRQRGDRVVKRFVVNAA
jgi:4-amino-4-deoxy-L-arabinose transferase-like glycosyltransferase